MEEDPDGMDDFFDGLYSVLLRIVVLLGVIALLAYLYCASASSAPAPFPKSQRIQPGLNADRLVGKWTMYWNGGKFGLKLWSGGRYECVTDSGFVTWSGSWHVREKKFWVTESHTPENPESWRSFGCPLDPKTLEGVIDEGDFKGTKIRLEK